MKIYFIKTNSGNDIIFENGGRWFAAADDNGHDIDTGIDLYSDNAAEELRTAYAALEFNPFDDNFRGAVLKGEDFSAEVEDTAESVELIREVID